MVPIWSLSCRYPAPGMMKYLLGVMCVVGLSPSLQAQTNVPKQESESRMPPPTMSDVAYGRHERQVLDFWKAAANQPTPLMIYFHGGGFKKGSKRQISRDIHVNEYLRNGISCISANYPFSETMDIPTVCKECEGVVAFARSKTEEWNIDPKRIGVSGCSAGAIIAFWIGTQKHEEVSVIGATQQPIGTVVLLPYITAASPPCIIYQEAPERNQLHGPVNAQMIKDAYAKHGVECLVYGAGANKFDTPPDGKDKFAIMLEFYMRKWGLSAAGNNAR